MMKKIVLLLATLPLLTLFSLASFAQTEVDLDDVTMDVVDDQADFKKGHRLRMPGRKVILEYMLENGDITQEDIDSMKAERQAMRSELKALREAGDREALDARRTELKEQRAARREELKAYVQEHDDLKQALREKRQEIKERRRNAREERRRRREERRGGEGE